jgi:hypothetical protein
MLWFHLDWGCSCFWQLVLWKHTIIDAAYVTHAVCFCCLVIITAVETVQGTSSNLRADPEALHGVRVYQ